MKSEDVFTGVAVAFEAIGSLSPLPSVTTVKPGGSVRSSCSAAARARRSDRTRFEASVPSESVWPETVRLPESVSAPMRSAVITASMAPGVNAYLFASIYNSAKRVAASTVLVSTALSMLSIWFWLSVLP